MAASRDTRKQLIAIVVSVAALGAGALAFNARKNTPGPQLSATADGGPAPAPTPDGGPTPPPAPTQTATKTCDAPNLAKPLKLKAVTQFGIQWCWAASAEMITQGDLKQCVHASDRFPEKNDPYYCCNYSKPEQMPQGCDETGWPRFVAHDYSTSVLAAGWPDVDTLKTEIDAGRAFAVTEEYPSPNANERPTAHMFVVTGYAVIGGVTFAELYDPSGAYSWHIYKNSTMLDGEDTYRPIRAYFSIQATKGGDPSRCKQMDSGAVADDACNECWVYQNGVCPTSATGGAIAGNGVPPSAPSSSILAGGLQGQPISTQPGAPPLPHVGVALGAPQPVSCSQGSGSNDALTEARLSIATLKELGNADPASLNFTATKPADQAALDEQTPPLPSAYLHVGATSTSAEVPGAFIYFYKVGTKDLGMLRVMKHSDDKWRAVAFFQDRWASELASETRSLFLHQHITPTLVIVPELNLRLLKIKKNNVEVLLLVKPAFGLQPQAFTPESLWEKLRGRPGFKYLIH